MHERAREREAERQARPTSLLIRLHIGGTVRQARQPARAIGCMRLATGWRRGWWWSSGAWPRDINNTFGRLPLFTVGRYNRGFPLLVGGRPTVGHMALNHGIGVRIPASQPITSKLPSLSIAARCLVRCHLLP